MNEEDIKTIDIGGVDVPLPTIDGHIVTGAVVIVATAGMDDRGTQEGFIYTSSSMPDYQFLGMLHNAVLELEEDIRNPGREHD